MTQEEKYSLHLPYGIICKRFKENDILFGIDRDGIGSFLNTGNLLLKDCEPYFRSFNQLTKECVQDDYNDGKPFIPIERIYNISNQKIGLTWFANNNVLNLPYIILIELVKMHFAIGFEKDEYIEVTNENNPYI